VERRGPAAAALPARQHDPLARPGEPLTQQAPDRLRRHVDHEVLRRGFERRGLAARGDLVPCRERLTRSDRGAGKGHRCLQTRLTATTLDERWPWPLECPSPPPCAGRTSVVTS